MILAFQSFLKKRQLKRDPHNKLLRGAWGELQACRYLRKKGYRLLAKNWRSGHWELDAVCWDGPVLVFVEVRTCEHLSKQGGVYSIGLEKKQALRRGCTAFLQKMPKRAAHYRFDSIEVRYEGLEVASIRHYERVSLGI